MRDTRHPREIARKLTALQRTALFWMRVSPREWWEIKHTDGVRGGNGLVTKGLAERRGYYDFRLTELGCQVLEHAIALRAAARGEPELRLEDLIAVACDADADAIARLGGEAVAKRKARATIEALALRAASSSPGVAELDGVRLCGWRVVTDPDNRDDYSLEAAGDRFPARIPAGGFVEAVVEGSREGVASLRRLLRARKRA